MENNYHKGYVNDEKIRHYFEQFNFLKIVGNQRRWFKFLNYTAQSYFPMKPDLQN